jgi:protocatechuate 3,4-dioxygenase, alpha subunit
VPEKHARPVQTLPDPKVRHETLLARKVKTGLYRFDIRLQGDRETVILDI